MRNRENLRKKLVSDTLSDSANPSALKIKLRSRTNSKKHHKETQALAAMKTITKYFFPLRKKQFIAQR